MVLFNFFSSNIKIQYKNTFCSKATLFIFITTLIAVLSPLILVYRSKGFWLKSHVFYEQPDVRFKYHYFFIAETDEIDSVIACGNIPITFISDILKDECNLIKVREEDFNDDNKIDEIHFMVQVENPQGKKIYSLKLFLLFDYKLHGSCLLQMESLAVIEKNFGLPIAQHFLSANLQLAQAFPLPCWPNYKDERFNYSIFADYDENNKNNWLQDILYRYSRRNVSTTLTNIYSNNKYGITPELELSVSIAIPENVVRYKPGVWQEMKHFWQQYLSVALIFYWILYKIKCYVFESRLIPAWQKVPWKKNF